ncbi:hypothetical protein RhiirB3_454879 [Rhizophagus irregularis]|nr:hypothetical protein RhiirB3_454879 [Rhizophagus irregularis]
MSIAKTSIQIAIIKGLTAELIEILMQFIMKYCSLNIEKSTISFSNTIDTIYCIYKSTVENNRITSEKPNDVTIQKMCSYCSRKGHNIYGYPKYKAESSANKENEYLV